MKQIAEQTGGQAYIDTNGLKEAVEGAVENGSSYYTVGYAPGGKLDGQFRKITLRLDDAAAYKLAYRRGYYADPSEKPSAHNAGEPTLMTAATLLGAPPTARRRSSGNTTPATGSPASQTLTPVTSVGSNISRISNCLRPMAGDTSWRADRRHVRAQRCCKGARCAADAAGFSASDTAPRGASKRPGMSATAGTAISVSGTVNLSQGRPSTRPSEP
jgi:hypothetical protein